MDRQTALRAEVFAQIKGYLQARGDIDMNQVREEATLSDLDIDSLDLVAMAQVVQDEFKVSLDDENIMSVDTLGDVLTFVVARLDRVDVARTSEVS
jgi:acyl carrier protein